MKKVAGLRLMFTLLSSKPAYINNLIIYGVEHKHDMRIAVIIYVKWLPRYLGLKHEKNQSNK